MVSGRLPINSHKQIENVKKLDLKLRVFVLRLSLTLKQLKRFFDDAWKRSTPCSNPVEQGGLVKSNGRYLINRKFPRLQGTRARSLEGFPDWATKNAGTEPGRYASPTKTLFWYHTHPFDEGDVLGTLPDGRQMIAIDQNFPSLGDRGTSANLGLYGVAITSTSIAVFGPMGRRCRFDR